jgi:hypothetical protein
MVQTSDVLYFEALDLPLPELQGLKTLKVAFHNSKTEEVTLPLDVNLTFSGVSYIACFRYKACSLNHKWSTIGYEMFLNVIGRSFWLLCDAYISTAHQENVGLK